MSRKIYNSIPDATLIGSILVAYVFDHILPVMEIIPYPVTLIGWVVAAAGLGLAISTLSMLKTTRTSTDPGGVPSTLVTTGFYSISRNPIYLGYVITTSGAAIILGSVTACSAPVICFSVLHAVIIPVEEKNLHRIFGHTYDQYQHEVRRWI